MSSLIHQLTSAWRPSSVAENAWHDNQQSVFYGARPQLTGNPDADRYIGAYCRFVDWVVTRPLRDVFPLGFMVNVGYSGDKQIKKVNRRGGDSFCQLIPSGVLTIRHHNTVSRYIPLRDGSMEVTRHSRKVAKPRVGEIRGATRSYQVLRVTITPRGEVSRSKESLTSSDDSWVFNLGPDDFRAAWG